LIVGSLEVQNNFEEYLGLSSRQEIVITKGLVGLVPQYVDEDCLKAERLSRQS
jgi:hypothetical protein